VKIALIARDFASYTHRRLIEMAGHRGVEITLYNPFQMVVGGRELHCEGKEFGSHDLALLRTSIHAHEREFILTIGRYLEGRGIPVVNRASSIEMASNKFHTYQVLTASGIPAVASVALRSRGALDQAVKVLGGFPLMLKFFYGTHGTGVVYVENYAMLSALVDSYWALKANIFLQPFVKETGGRCLRIILLGKRVIATARMIPREGDFRSNYKKGGSRACEEAGAEALSLAFRAKEALGLYFTAIDMLTTAEGALVLEVNSSPGIESLEQVLKIDLATGILDGLVELVGRD
jgi:ribosomal protein S6--L-glutamate ligase